jgi:hypothetical protein
MRPIDADALIATMENMRSISDNVKQRQIEESILHGIVPQIIDDAPTIEAEPVNGWISVKDRLPESDGFYLAWYTFKDGGHALDIFYFNAGSPISNAITHWKPLPEPPKGE